ncbi:hypothetical protein HPP92_020930 [Vanilla planifolia]|uniref:Uncharacterized protein n=1 Tax=Vanilla planifolia TaxID=51239 RepID=A0A835PX67_VANPL|nr:hypothetical protein HPP92_020930 [Vanilla planifolia]
MPSENTICRPLPASTFNPFTLSHPNKAHPIPSDTIKTPPPASLPPLALQMDKLLAMSIMSWGPNFSGGEIRVFAEFAVQLITKPKEKAEKGSGKASHGKSPLRGRKEKPYFALEFDGLHCFETIVSC